MTSGNIQMGPDPDRIFEEEFLRDAPAEWPADEVSGEGEPT